MALNSSGPISIAGTTAGQSIQIELGGNGTTQMSLNDASVRTLAGVPSGEITMPTNFYGKSNRVAISLTISASQLNYVLNTAKVSGLGYVAGNSDITVTINSAIYVYSNSTATAGMRVDTSWSAGDTITIVNNGIIHGMGGNGGGGGNFGGGSGSAGGNALTVQRTVSINNTSGVIAGGGGGGGGGGGYVYNCCGVEYYNTGGGGGGGRTGLTNSSGGGGWIGGGAGTSSSPGGGGGQGGGLPINAGAGGTGGQRGSSGNNGQGGGSGGGGSGGSGGSAVSGNSFITWIATGTRNGAIT